MGDRGQCVHPADPCTMVMESLYQYVCDVISPEPTLRGGFQNPVAPQPLGIRRPWHSFPTPLAPGGGHGIESDGVGGGDHRSDRGPAAEHRTTTHADNQGGRDAALLRP